MPQNNFRKYLQKVNLSFTTKQRITNIIFSDRKIPSISYKTMNYSRNPKISELFFQISILSNVRILLFYKFLIPFKTFILVPWSSYVFLRNLQIAMILQGWIIATIGITCH